MFPSKSQSVTMRSRRATGIFSWRKSRLGIPETSTARLKIRAAKHSEWTRLIAADTKKFHNENASMKRKFRREQRENAHYLRQQMKAKRAENAPDPRTATILRERLEELKSFVVRSRQEGSAGVGCKVKKVRDENVAIKSVVKRDCSRRIGAR